MFRKIIRSFRKIYYSLKGSKALPGTKEWLIATELRYGGIQTKVLRKKVSPRDPRTREQILSGGMTGGDRMLHNGYASKYSEYLFKYIKENKPVTVAEFGILKGTGLAIWCDLFANARVLGFDIDTRYVNENMKNLISLGAFKNNKPEIYEFDQFEDNVEYLGAILKGDVINICIDDGHHSAESILNTMQSAMPYLADDVTYFVEDNRKVHTEIRRLYPDFWVDNDGRFTVVSKQKPTFE